MYKFNSAEYAQLLGITASALRKRRLSGKLEGLYKVIDGQYMYAAPRPNKVSFTGKKRRRNVPRHLTRYTSSAMAAANDLKQLARIQRLLTENEVQEITPDIIEVAKERRRKRLEEAACPLLPEACRLAPLKTAYNP